MAYPDHNCHDKREAGRHLTHREGGVKMEQREL